MTTARSTAAWKARHAASAIVLVAVGSLVAFYYLARADTVGVYALERGWSALTGRPVAWPLHFAASALLLGVLPVLASRWLTGQRPRDLGLGLGNGWRGLALLAVGIPTAILGGKIASLSPGVRAIYPLDPKLSAAAASFVPYALGEFLYYGAWEVLFRGVLLFGLRARLGDSASNALQTALSVTAHFGRPLSETFAALPAGLVFGWIDLRLGSVWYVAVIHWVVGVSMDWFILTA